MRPDASTLIAAKRIALYIDAVLDDATTGVIDVAPGDRDAETVMEVLHELTLGDVQRVVTYVLTAAHQ